MKRIDLTAEELKKLNEIARRDDKSMKAVLQSFVREGLARDGK